MTRAPLATAAAPTRQRGHHTSSKSGSTSRTMPSYSWRFLRCVSSSTPMQRPSARSSWPSANRTRAPLLAHRDRICRSLVQSASGVAGLQDQPEAGHPLNVIQLPGPGLPHLGVQIGEAKPGPGRDHPLLTGHGQAAGEAGPLQPGHMPPGHPIPHPVQIRHHRQWAAELLAVEPQHRRVPLRESHLPGVRPPGPLPVGGRHRRPPTCPATDPGAVLRHPGWMLRSTPRRGVRTVRFAHPLTEGA
jgi:hypothetical protein